MKFLTDYTQTRSNNFTLLRLIAALMVTFGVAYEVLFNPDNVLLTLSSVLTPPLVLAPWNFRISRAIMLYALGGIEKD